MFDVDHDIVVVVVVVIVVMAVCASFILFNLLLVSFISNLHFVPSRITFGSKFIVITDKRLS